ncbi:hypothetical protein [Alienimonas sp. DA493]|uniref:hypothetical protein n=1 Tax=Alienimonas sp. DA493 TaxID=3373605 RepID=UPI003754E9C1
MASPFEIFRRNQWLVVALFGLSIFAFVLLDPLTSGGGDNGLFPIVLGVLLGGVAAWLISNTTGRAAVMWAAAGAVAGGLFVGLSGNFFGGDVAVRTAEGDLTRNDLYELQRRNQIANQFFVGLKDKLEEREPDNEALRGTPPPNFNYVGVRPGPFGLQQIPNILSQFDPNAPEEFGLVFAYLLEQEADEAGLEISDDYVNALINSHYGVSPTREEIRELRTRMGVGETDLFDAIRAELRHRRMFELLAPNPTSLPTDAWELYRKLNQTADVAYVSLPVEEFVPQVAEPSEAEVSQLFEDYRGQQPDPATGLGFLRPAQISLGYLTVDRDAVEESVDAPTDEEVRAYYEANKSEFRNPAYTEWLSEQRQMENQSEIDSLLEGGAGPGLPTLSPDAPADAPAMPAEDPQPQPTDEPQPAPAEEPTAEEPAEEPSEEPAMTAPTEEPAPADPAGDDDGEESPEPAATGESDEPAMTEPAAEEGEPQPQPSSEEPQPEEPSSEEPESGEEAGSEEEDGDSTARMRAFEARGFASLPAEPQEEETQEENGEQPPAEEEETETAAAELEAEAEGDEPAMTEQPAAEQPPAEQPPAEEEEATEEPPAEPAMTEQPADAPAEDSAEEPAEGADAPPAPTREKPEEFLPLNAERTEEIRERLKRDAVSEEMTRRIDAARDFMFLLGEEVWSEVPSPDDPASDVTEEEAEELRTAARETIAERMATYAEENGLTYNRLPFLGLNELIDGDYPVATAEIPGSARTGQPQLAIAPLLGNFQTPLFNDVRVGETPDGSALYAIWKADQRLPAEQELTDEGVREAVVAAFKRQKAAEAAAARADELAEQASAEGVTLQQVVEGQTVTGAEGGAPLEIQETGPFRRLRVNRPTGLEAFLSGPSPARNPVPTFENGLVSEEFLDAAFDDLAPGEAAGVPGFRPDRSLTVELKSRQPSDEELSTLYENFLEEAAAEPRLYRQAGIEERRVALEAFINGLFEKYGVDRGAIGAMDRDG